MRSKRCVAYLFADVFLALFLALLSLIGDGGEQGFQPQEVMDVSVDAQRVRWRGRWADVARLDKGGFAGKSIGLTVPPQADASLVIALQLSLERAGAEVSYAAP